MGTSMSFVGCPAKFFSIGQVAGMLGVDQGRISRMIRVGELRAVRRRSRLVIPAAELARVLGGGDAR